MDLFNEISTYFTPREYLTFIKTLVFNSKNIENFKGDKELQEYFLTTKMHLPGYDEKDPIKRVFDCLDDRNYTKRAIRKCYPFVAHGNFEFVQLWTRLVQLLQNSFITAVDYLDIGQLLSDGRMKSEIFRQTLYGENALMIAARRGHTDIVRMLLDSGKLLMTPEVFGQINDKGYNALMLAANDGYTEVIRLLLGAGESLMTNDVFGQTTKGGMNALMLAASNGRRDHKNALQLAIDRLNKTNDENKKTLFTEVIRLLRWWKQSKEREFEILK